MLADMHRTISNREADRAFGATINALLFINNKTRRGLGEILGISGPAVSNKISGKATWTLLEVLRAANFFGVSAAEILPSILDDDATAFAPFVPQLPSTVINVKRPEGESNPRATD